MSTVTAEPIRTAPTASSARTVARWMFSFLGFPLGGFAAWLLTGPVVDTTSAVTGGFLTGAILGAVQAWALRYDARLIIIWTLLTAGGMAVGLATGATRVSFSTQLADLALQGAVSGGVVGLAQAVALFRRLGSLALAWPACVAGAWAAGWTVTTLAGIGVGEQFTVFGASGALVAALLTVVLPLVLRTRRGLSQVSAA